MVGLLNISNPGTIWAPISIDGGGYVTGMDFASDGTIVARTDTFGCYVRNSSSTVWSRLLTTSSMPANTFGFNSSGNWVTPAGVFEIRIAPSNSQILYLLYAGNVYKTTNQGNSWTQLSFPSFSYSGDENGVVQRWYQKKIAIHPTDPNTVIVGTPAGPTNGAYYTTNGGTSWTGILPVPTSRGCVTGIVFDLATPANIYAASNGNGVYQTTSGVSGTWSLLSGSPTKVTDAVVTGGNYFCCDGTHIQAYTGTWAQQSPSSSNGYWCICVDPNNTNHLFALDQAGAQPAQSNNSGSTWQEIASYTSGTITTGDAGWLTQKTPSSGFFGTVSCHFDVSVSNRIWVGWNYGIQYCDGVATTSGAPQAPITWVTKIAGVQNQVGRNVISPPGGNPVVSAEDNQEFFVSNPASNPTSFGITHQNEEQATITVDYAKSSPSTIVAYTNWNGSNSDTSSGFFNTTTAFTNLPTAGFGSLGGGGGNIAAATPTNIVALAFNQTNPVVYTNNGGSSAWTAATGLPNFTWPFGSSSWGANSQLLTCDVSGNYYVYSCSGNTTANGTYYSTNGGASWSLGSSTNLNSVGFFQPTLRAVPAISQFVVFTPGGVLGSIHPTTQVLSYSTNAGASMTWNSVPNVKDVWAIGFGQAAPGFSNPTTWIVGWVGGVYGIWVSKNFTTTPSSATWTWLIDYPFGSFDQIVDITGDQNDYTKCYFSFNGSSFGYGKNLVY